MKIKKNDLCEVREKSNLIFSGKITEGGEKNMASINDLIEKTKTMKAQEANRINSMIERNEISYKDVCNILSSLAQAGNTQFVKNALCAYSNTGKLSEVEQRNYANILRAVIAEFC